MKSFCYSGQVDEIYVWKSFIYVIMAETMPSNENGEKVIPSRLYLKVGYTNLGYTIRPFGITYLHFGITYFGGSLCVLLHHRYWCLHSQSFNCLPLLSNLKSNIVTSYFVHAPVLLLQSQELAHLGLSVIFYF